MANSAFTQSSVLPWSEETGTTAALISNAGVIANNASLVTLTLPATATIGDVINIQGKGAGLWRVAQNAGQTVHFGSVDSMTGAGGSITATNRYDSISLVCITTDTDFAVLSSIGTMTVV